MAKKLYVRFSTKADEQAIFDYYASHTHKFVFQRDPAIWRERIASGAVTLIEDAQGKIVGSSISYPIMGKDDKGNDIHRWSELGSTRISMDGIGLSNTLINAQVLRAFLLEPPTDRFVYEIVKGNEHSKHVFSKLGGVPYTIPEELRKQVMATVTDSGGQQVEWFEFPPDTMLRFAADFVASVKNPPVRQGKDGESYQLDFSRCLLAKNFMPELEKLAGMAPPARDASLTNAKIAAKAFKK